MSVAEDAVELIGLPHEPWLRGFVPAAAIPVAFAVVVLTDSIRVLWEALLPIVVDRLLIRRDGCVALEGDYNGPGTIRRVRIVRERPGVTVGATWRS